MHVLMITQRVDSSHDVLGFVTEWIATLAERVDELSVLTAYTGDHDLPNNVTLYSYGKERNYSKPRRVLAFQRHCRTLAGSGSVDVVFSHMIPKFTIASWPWFGIRGVPYVQWYAHGAVTWDLRVAHHLVDLVVTSTAQGFQLESNKVNVVGQGIDTDRFAPGEDETDRSRLLGVGRVDPVKNFEVLVDAVAELKGRGHGVSLRIVGDSSNSAHVEEIRKRARTAGVDGVVEFVGSIPHEEIAHEYQQAGLFLNASQTGSLDKTEIEALACGTPTVSCNDSYREMVTHEDIEPSLLTFPPDDATALADRVEQLLEMEDDKFELICKRGRRVIGKNHAINSLMDSLSEKFRIISQD